MGTIGYIDPEYATTLRLNEKFDVGMIMHCSFRAIDRDESCG
jgi:hypothetical protein